MCHENLIRIFIIEHSKTRIKDLTLMTIRSYSIYFGVKLWRNSQPWNFGKATERFKDLTKK